ncbi:MAG: hypothetical protein M1840_000301 [Geoglossum simile]|nr:MAG: hypothetical protein M1840_000301 [Geoglossum simile]
MVCARSGCFVGDGASAVSGGVVGTVFNFCEGILAFAVLGLSIEASITTGCGTGGTGGTGGICPSDNAVALEALRDDMLDLLLRSSPLALPNNPPKPPPVLAPTTPTGEPSVSLSGLVLGLVARLDDPTLNAPLSLPTGEFVLLMLLDFSEPLEGEGSRDLGWTVAARTSSFGASSRMGDDDVWIDGIENRIDPEDQDLNWSSM